MISIKIGRIWQNWSLYSLSSSDLIIIITIKNGLSLPYVDRAKIQKGSQHCNNILYRRVTPFDHYDWQHRLSPHDSAPLVNIRFPAAGSVPRAVIVSHSKVVSVASVRWLVASYQYSALIVCNNNNNYK